MGVKSNNIKILFLTNGFYPSIGGIEVNAEVLANEFYKAGHPVHLITKTVLQGSKSFPYTIIRNPNIKTLIKEHFWADIIFENNSCLRLSWPTYIFRLPSVVAINTWIRRTDERISFIDKVKIRLLKKTKKVIAVSEAVRKKTCGEAIVIHNPYRAEQFRILPNIPRNKAFVFLGRLVSDKGADLAIKAFKQLANSHHSLKKNIFTIIGDGPELENLKREVAVYNLQDQIFFTGWLWGNDLIKVLNEHRIVLVPSVWEEPFGNVVLEGMACGCVPIVSGGGGLPEAVGKAGLIFERGNLDSLVGCMRLLVENALLLKKLKSVASDHLENHFPGKVAKKYLDVLELALK